MKQLTKITMEWDDGIWVIWGGGGVFTQADNLDQAVVMIRDAARCMGVAIPESDDLEIQPPTGATI